MSEAVLKAYRLAFGFTNMRFKEELFEVLGEVSPRAKQLILDDMKNWQSEENPLGIEVK